MKINNDPIKWERADEDYVISCYRELHQIPETGLFLPQTKAYIEKKLQEMGLTPVHYEGHSSVSAKICGRDESRVILLRADMDGLEMAEETGLPYASANGNMHSCGHDAHMAMLLGAARILMRYRQRMKGCVRLLFQAGEEEPGGAVLLLGQGILGTACRKPCGITKGEYRSEIRSGDGGKRQFFHYNSWKRVSRCDAGTRNRSCSNCRSDHSGFADTNQQGTQRDRTGGAYSWIGTWWCG